MSESSSSNSVAAPDFIPWESRTWRSPNYHARQKWIGQCVAHTLGRYIAEGCTFRSIGRELVIGVPSSRLRPRAVHVWVSRHKPLILDILMMADNVTVAEAELDLRPLYFARWLAHRGIIGEQRR